MLFYLAYRPLTLGDLVHSDVTKLKKNFLPWSIKFYILVVYRFLIKILGVNQCTSGHVIPQNMKFIRLAKYQPIFKIETSGLDHI